MVFLVKIILLIKRLIAAFFVNFILRPGRVVLRFIFYKAVVKFYSLYRSLMKRLGWSGGRETSLFSFLFNQKLVHLVVAFITLTLVFTNLIIDTRAQSLSGSENKTILFGLIQSEFGSQEEEKLIEEFFDQEAIISPAQQNYLDNLSAVKSQPVSGTNYDEQPGEEEGVDITQDGMAAIKPGASASKKTKRTRTAIVNYAVEPGDTVSTIAEEFEISVNTILWENNLSAYSIIRPGDSLVILPTSGVTHKVASGETLVGLAAKYKVESNEIVATNHLPEDGKIAIGQKLIIPGGQKATYASYQPNRYSGISAVKDLIKPPASKQAPGNKMAWPTVGSRITQYFSWRHFAIDIANKVGTPIYAADAGTIEVAGWGRGYGNQVVVNHGGGKKTRYGHMSKTLVEKGQKVDKGEVIGLMGSTGWSTGSHVHFEVIINGVKYNPLNYL